MKKYALYRDSFILLRLVLVLLLVVSIHAPIESARARGTGATQSPVQAIAQSHCFDLGDAVCHFVPTQDIAVTAFFSNIFIPPLSEPPFIRADEEPYWVPGVNPLASHLISLQKTSADL